MTSKGDQVGPFRLGKKLGKGAYSKVRHATNVRTGEAFAVKIIDKKQMANRGMEEQLQREITLLMRLRHPNVCGLRTWMQTADHVFLAMELADGGELLDKIVERRGFDEATARRYFQQIVQGLYYCHRQGVAHRDLKPENLLLDAAGTLKLADFGLSNMQRTTDSGKVAPSMMLHTKCGSPSYLSPEVFRGEAYNGFLADAWACGVLLYVLLCGRLPFPDTDMKKLFMNIQAGLYEDRPEFSEGVRRLLGRLLVVDPGQRATLDEIIQDEWFRVDWDESGLGGTLDDAVDTAPLDTEPVSPLGSPGPNSEPVTPTSGEVQYGLHPRKAAKSFHPRPTD